jgi:hypothetical protein
LQNGAILRRAGVHQMRNGVASAIDAPFFPSAATAMAVAAMPSAFRLRARVAAGRRCAPAFTAQVNKEAFMGTYAFWLYCLVILPLAFEALAGPIVLRQFGLRVAVPVLAMLWLAPMAIMYCVSAAPEILVWLVPLGNLQVTPPLAALICQTLAVWLALLAIWLAARSRHSLLAQSVISAVVSTAVLQLVSPSMQTWALQNLLNAG